MFRLFVVAVAALFAVAVAPLPPTITLQMVIHDFDAGVYGFEEFGGDDRGALNQVPQADRTPVASFATVSPGGTIQDPAWIQDWYHDRFSPRINYKFVVPLVLTNIGGGVYSYDNQQFYPIDGRGFGNNGRDCSGSGPHNFGFATHTSASFFYGGGEMLNFAGDDDVWVYINNRLALDLGGVHGTESGSIDLDAQAAALGISAGHTYNFDLFYNERHTCGSDISFQTTFQLAPVCHTGCGDPHFEGLNGVTYDFAGKAGKTFSLISAPDIEMDSTFVNFPDEPHHTYFGPICIRSCNDTVSVLPGDGGVLLNGRQIEWTSNYVATSHLEIYRRDPRIYQVTIPRKWDVHISVAENRKRLDVLQVRALGGAINVTNPSHSASGVIGGTLHAPVLEEHKKCINGLGEGGCDVYYQWYQYEVADPCSGNWMHTMYSCSA